MIYNAVFIYTSACGRAKCVSVSICVQELQRWDGRTSITEEPEWSPDALFTYSAREKVKRNRPGLLLSMLGLGSSLHSWRHEKLN